MAKTTGGSETGDGRIAAGGPTSWVMRLLGGRSFYPLFALLLVSLVFIVTGGEQRWAVFVGHILMAVRCAHASRIWIVLGWLGLILGIAGAVLQAFTEVRALRLVSAVLFVLLLFASLPLILRRLVAHSRVTGETVVGALCAYLLIGMDFAMLGVLLSTAEGGAIIASVANPGSAITRSDIYYHSFITMTTVGYGDYVPLTGAAKTLALLEGILGQLFLVTVVARLVSVATFRRIRSEEAAGPSADESRPGA